MSERNISKFDEKSGEFWEHREDLTRIFQSCLKRFNQTKLFEKEENCVRNYTQMLIEARKLVHTQLSNNYD